MPEVENSEIESEELEVQVEESDHSSEPEQEVVETSEKAVKQSSTAELENYSEGVQKRISKLTAKMREAERREQAALEYAKSVQQQLEESSRQRTSLDTSFVSEFENRVTYQEQALRNQLREAIDRGDVDAQVETQTQLARLAQDNERLAFVKKQQEEQAAQLQAQPQPQAVQPQQQVAAQPDPKASAWAERNEWFGSDEPMTLTAFSIHKQLIEGEGFDPASDEYYQELDRRIRRDFPHKFGEEQTPVRNGRSGPAVAGANRGGQRGGQKTVKLTQSQVAIARKLGISNEQYAKQLIRMQQDS